jgi:hypothetical protein
MITDQALRERALKAERHFLALLEVYNETKKPRDRERALTAWWVWVHLRSAVARLNGTRS